MACEIVAADIGGTHARFAIAEVVAGRVIALGPETTLRTADHASLAEAWAAFRRRFAQERGGVLPRAAGLAIAAPIEGDTLRLTNSPWAIARAMIGDTLGLDSYTLVNDFGAVGHAVAHVGGEHLRHLCGPDEALPAAGMISIVGPGTGLGVAQLLRSATAYEIVETEGGHIAFAPLDPFEDALLASLRRRFGRVSAERIVAGPGLAHIDQALAAADGGAAGMRDDKVLWTAALAGTDGRATAAMERFCLCLGAVAGDIALAQGARAVVIAGGLGLRLAEVLPRSGFAARFAAKGRFADRMAAMPVKLLTHPQPGLLGAAAAYAAEHGRP